MAELDTRRTVTLVGGGVEVADDRVKGTAFGDQPRIERWREVEAELIDGDEELLAKVGKRLRKAGAVPAGSASKLARLLEPAPPARAPVEPGSAAEVVVNYLADQVAALLAQDPRTRRAEEDAVHQMRVASRRLRSALKAFKSVVQDTGAVQDELKWLGAVLGEARDLEVIRARFAGHLRRLDPELVTGPIQVRLGDDLGKREEEAYGAIRAALSGERYFALLDALDRLVAEPSLGKAAGRPADTALAAIADKNWQRVTKTYDHAQAVTDPGEHETAMHDVRKAAKRARYTAEAIGMGKLAKRAEAVQETLGIHQDGVVAQETLAKEAESARQAGEDTFTYGVLVGIERAAAERAHADFPEVWAKVQIE